MIGILGGTGDGWAATNKWRYLYERMKHPQCRFAETSNQPDRTWGPRRPPPATLDTVRKYSLPAQEPRWVLKFSRDEPPLQPGEPPTPRMVRRWM
jgi:hypothetical protein